MLNIEDIKEVLYFWDIETEGLTDEEIREIYNEKCEWHEMVEEMEIR